MTPTSCTLSNGVTYYGTDAVLLLVRSRVSSRFVEASAACRGLVVPIMADDQHALILARAEMVRRAGRRVLCAIARRLIRRAQEMRRDCDQATALSWQYGLSPHFFDLSGVA